MENKYTDLVNIDRFMTDTYITGTTTISGKNLPDNTYKEECFNDINNFLSTIISYDDFFLLSSDEKESIILENISRYMKIKYFF